MTDRACPIQQRREALAWIKPLWNRLITAASELAPDVDARRVELVEQQLAVLLYLDEIEENGVPDKPSLGPASTARSEERRVGKECVSTCRSRWSPYP